MLFKYLWITLIHDDEEENKEYIIRANLGGDLTIEMPWSSDEYTMSRIEILKLLETELDFHEWNKVHFRLYEKHCDDENCLSNCVGINTAYEGLYSFGLMAKMRYTQQEKQKSIREFDHHFDDVSDTDEDYDWDWSTDLVHSWFVEEKISPLLNKLIQSGQAMQNVLRLKDKECPVLMTPLKVGLAVKLDFCNHFLSRAAYDQLLVNGNGEFDCPLCRHHYHMGGITNL